MYLAGALVWVVTLSLESEVTSLAGLLLLGFQAGVLATTIVVIRRETRLEHAITLLVIATIALGVSWIGFFVAHGGPAAQVGMILAALCASAGLAFALRWHTMLLLLACTLWALMLADPWLTQIIPPLQSVAGIAMGTVIIIIMAEATHQSFRRNIERRASDTEMRRQLEVSRDAYRNGELKFRSLAESMAVAVFIVQETSLRYVNPAAIAMTGYSRDELLHMRFWEVVHPDERERVRARGLARQRGVSLPAHFEYRLRTKDGRDVWVDFRAVTMEFEGRPAMLGTSIDVTEPKQMAEALAASEHRYRDLVESQRELIVRCTPEGTGIITFANDAYCEAFGCDRANLIGQGLVALYHEDDVQLFADIIDDVKSRRDHHVVTARSYTTEGMRWFEWQIASIRDESDSVVEVQAVGRDITARKEAEAKLRSSLAELSRSEEKLRRLALSQVAIREEERKHLGLDLHDDVCQELVGIGILLESVRQRLAPNTAGIGDLKRGARYLSEVVEHLRALASDLRPLQLRDLGLLDSLHALAQGMSSDRTHVDVSCPDPVPQLEEETELAFYRVAQEATVNALRHGSPRSVQMILTVENGSIRLKVNDDGSGFDTTEVDDRGLGLVSMEERALSLGGRFNVWSEPGRGATLLFECPLQTRRDAA